MGSAFRRFVAEVGLLLASRLAADLLLLRLDVGRKECSWAARFGCILLPFTNNNQLRTGADKGNPTV